MNKNTKRRISSFLAFTMFLSTMTANNVSIYAENESGLPDGFALMEVDDTASEEALDFSSVDFEQYKAAIPESGDPDFFDAIEFSDAETGEMLRDFLRTVSQDARDIFILRYVYMLPVKEIAERNQISVSKVKVSLYRTRGELRRYLGGEPL